MIEILILSIVQGITEFIPVSSSSHLIVLSNLSEFDSNDISIDVNLHLGSLLAVIIFFKKEIVNFTKNKKLFKKIILSSLPVIILGYLLIHYNLIDHIRNLKTIAWTTLIFGVLLYISDRFKSKKKLEKDFSYKIAIIIGLFQMLSLIPGVSRSGIVISAARMSNFNRFDSAKISFLLSIPTLGIISVYGVKNLIISNDLNFSILNISSIILSFIFSFLTIKFFLKFVKKFSLIYFVLYRFFLGLVLLYIVYL
tara:strand:+ start:712 stop:1470 length:759 start_codon:yes stop_codon:yes gene_type:complete